MDLIIITCLLVVLNFQISIWLPLRIPRGVLFLLLGFLIPLFIFLLSKLIVYFNCDRRIVQSLIFSASFLYLYYLLKLIHDHFETTRQNRLVAHKIISIIIKVPLLLAIGISIFQFLLIFISIPN